MTNVFIFIAAILIVLALSLLFLGYCKECHDKPNHIFKCPKCGKESSYVEFAHYLITTGGDPMAHKNLLCRCTGYPDTEMDKIGNKSKIEKFVSLFWVPLQYLIVVIDKVKK